MGWSAHRGAAALLLAAAAATPAARAEELIRVVAAEGLARATLVGDGLTLRQPDEEGAGQRAAGPLEVTLAGGALRVGGEPWPGALVVTGSGPIRLGERALSPALQLEPGAGGITVIEELPLDDYVAGVVSGELPRSFPAEAQKAQAVAARTYALVRKIEAEASGRSWHLGAGVLSQVYAGAAPNPAARAAAAATRGEVLVHGNDPVEAFFHASCGGRTEGGLDALGRDLPYLASVPCGHCYDAPRVHWSISLGGAELGRLLGLSGPVTAVRVIERTASGRVARIELEVGGKATVLGGADLRQRLGFGKLPSLAFDVKGRKGTFTLDGRGQGHGAGLCQWGAAGLAREGKGYREILRHYYRGTDVVKMY